MIDDSRKQSQRRLDFIDVLCHIFKMTVREHNIFYRVLLVTNDVPLKIQYCSSS